MCGRYWIDPAEMSEIEKLADEIDRKMRAKQFGGDLFPGSYAPVLERTAAGMMLTFQKWGYPSHQKNGVIFNARSETVTEKKMFQNGILRHRIVIPAGGFYEWNRSRERNCFTRNDSEIMYMAGFCDCFENVKRFIILTTAANASMIKVHDRMPLILEQDQLNEWLDNDSAVGGILRQTSPELERFSEYEQQTLF